MGRKRPAGRFQEVRGGSVEQDAASFDAERAEAERVMSEAVIEAKGLVKKYGQLEAVRGIDLEVKQGEIFGFLGPNGAGKSTTISMLCTLLKPTAGSASVAGIDVVHDPARGRPRIRVLVSGPNRERGGEGERGGLRGRPVH